MGEQLGKIEKPAAEGFKDNKKIYLVPLVYLSDGAPPEYKEKCDRYWQQVAEQLAKLEGTIGKVRWVYHESVSQSGEDGMKVVERASPGSYDIAKGKCDQGAVFEAMEDKELLEETMDWERCLLLGFMSQRVAGKVFEFYGEASGKRYEFMARRISETLHDKEAGLLFIREGHRLQFPDDIEVFSVFPPALDEIHRWVRDQAREVREKPAAGDEEPATGPEEAEVEEKQGRKARKRKAKD